MTVLAPPTVRAQLSAQLHPWDDCGEADCASVITDAGTSVSVETVANWATATGNDYSNGETDAEQLAAILKHWNVPSIVRSAPMSETIPAALAARHEIIVLLDSNDYGIPQPGTGIGHWLLVYGDGGGDYQVMQPLGNPPGGSLQSYSQSLMQAADQQSAVEINMVLPKDATSAPPPSPLPYQPSTTSGSSLGPGLLVVGAGIGIVGFELWRNPGLRRRLLSPLASI